MDQAEETTIDCSCTRSFPITGTCRLRCLSPQSGLPSHCLRQGFPGHQAAELESRA